MEGLADGMGMGSNSRLAIHEIKIVKVAWWIVRYQYQLG